MGLNVKGEGRMGRKGRVEEGKTKMEEAGVGGGGRGTLVSTATQSTNCLSSKHEEAVALLSIPGGAGVVPSSAEKCSLGKASSNAHLVDLIRYAPLLKIINK